MSSEQVDIPQPPQPPPFKRKLEFNRVQQLGVPILILFPLLAILGVFGGNLSEVDASSPHLNLRVEYPTQTRYLLPHEMNIQVQNISAQTIPTVTVGISAEYITSFTQVTFTPDVDEATDKEYRVELTDVAPGEIRQISLDIRGYSYGPTTGAISAEPDGGEAVDVSISTFIFP